MATRYLDAHKARHGRPSPHHFKAVAAVLSRFDGVDPDQLLAAALDAKTITVAAVEFELRRGTNGSQVNRVYARGDARS